MQIKALLLAWILTVLGFQAASANPNTWKTVCGESTKNLRQCTWYKREGVMLGNKNGYIVVTDTGKTTVEWWLPNGTGQCRFYNTHLRATSEKWRPINAYCTEQGLIEFRELTGALVFVTEIGG